MNTNSAVKRTKEFLEKYWKDRPELGQVHIYTWNLKQLRVGVRVAEVSFDSFNPATMSGGGCSFMQVDLEGALPCFFAERAILGLLTYPDDFEEQLADFERLLISVFGEEPVDQFLQDWYAEHPLKEEEEK